MKTFPMFLTMANRRVVICGGGEQAAQKYRLMKKTEAQIEIAALDLDPELLSAVKDKQAIWHKAAITPQLFQDVALIFIATGCVATDHCLHDFAKFSGAPVNVVDQPNLCTAITPSLVDRDPVVVAIGTEGTAPVLARQIKTKLEESLEPRLGNLAALAGHLRDLAAQRLSAKKRRDLWRWVFAGPIRSHHARGEERKAAQMLKSAILDGWSEDADMPRLSWIAAHPNKSDFLTLRSVQRLQEADIIFYDSHIAPSVLEVARRDAQRVTVHHGPDVLSPSVAKQLSNAARQGDRVVRLFDQNRLTNSNADDELQQELKEANTLGLEGEILFAGNATDTRAPSGHPHALAHPKSETVQMRSML